MQLHSSWNQPCGWCMMRQAERREEGMDDGKGCAAAIPFPLRAFSWLPRWMRRRSCEASPSTSTTLIAAVRSSKFFTQIFLLDDAPCLPTRVNGPAEAGRDREFGSDGFGEFSADPSGGHQPSPVGQWRSHADGRLDQGWKPELWISLAVCPV
jgi:hypothetical protein